MISRLRNLFLYFSVTFLISGIASFIAYNWKEMNSFEKLAVPAFLVFLGVAGWFIFKKEIFKNLSLFFASFMIGILFAVFGQVYQTGADAYSLFLNWGIFTFIFAVAGGFSPIWLLNIATFTTAIALYFKLTSGIIIGIFYSTWFLWGVILVYIAIVKSTKKEMNKTFFYLVTTAFLIMITFSFICINLQGRKLLDIWVHTPTKQFYFDVAVYLITVGSLTYISEKKIERYGVLPLTIVSGSFVLWSEIHKIFSQILSLTDDDITVFFGYFITLVALLGGTIFLLGKTSLKKENLFLKKTIIVIISMMKFIFAVVLFLLFVTYIFLFGFSEVGVLFIGAGLISAAFWLPKELKFKEDKTEIISFSVGMVFLILFLILMEITNANLLVLLVLIIFNSAYIFAHCRAFDFLFIPVHLISLGIIWITNFEIFSLTSIINSILIITLVLLGISIVFERKIEKYLKIKAKGKVIDKLKRIGRGNEIFIILIALCEAMYPTSIFTKIVVLAIIAIIILMNFRKEKILSYLVVGATVLAIQYYYIYSNIIVAIMFIFLYIHRKEKFCERGAILFFAFEIISYYYSKQETLLIKSVSMEKTGAILLLSYIILTYLSKKEKHDTSMEELYEK